MTNEVTRKRLDDLATALGDVSPDRLNSLVRKDQRLNIRATAAEKADMQATAAALGLSLSEYLCGLHLIAGPRLAHSMQPSKAKEAPEPEKKAKAAHSPASTPRTQASNHIGPEWEQADAYTWIRKVGPGKNVIIQATSRGPKSLYEVTFPGGTSKPATSLEKAMEIGEKWIAVQGARTI